MPETSEEQTARTLADLERRLYEGLTASSPESLDPVMSEDLVYIHSQGTAETKHDNLTGQSSGFFKHGPVKRTSGYTRVYGELAVTVGSLEMVDLAHGPTYTLYLEQTLVWAREAGAWKLILRQATKAQR